MQKNELRNRFIKKNQEVLQEIGIKSENREYSKEEIKSFSNIIGEHIYSQSSKNGDMAKAINKYGDVLNIFVRNEK